MNTKKEIKKNFFTVIFGIKAQNMLYNIKKILHICKKKCNFALS